MKKGSCLFFALFIFQGCFFKENILKKNFVQEKKNTMSRTYSEKKDIVFESVLHSLQEIGYLINVSNRDAGLIKAETISSVEKFKKVVFGVLPSVQQKAKVLIEENTSKEIKVYLNFFRFFKGNDSSKTERTPILNQKIYQKFFDLIQKNIIIRT